MFYVPINMIQFFFEKGNSLNRGSYRHVQAHRIYLYLLHYKSGRICKIKDLTTFFGSSKQSIQKSLDWLVETGLLTNTKGYYEAIGKRRFSKNNYSNLNSLGCANSFKFLKSDLLDGKVFKAKVFKYLGQNLANAYGEKRKSIVHPAMGGLLKGDFTTKVSMHCIQDQALSYLGKCLKRSPRTIQNRLKTVVDYNNSKPVLDKENSVKLLNETTYQTLTQSGWKHLNGVTSNYLSELMGTSSFEETSAILNELKTTQPDLVSNCIVIRNSQSFLIGRKPANKFQYNYSDQKFKLSWGGKLLKDQRG